MNNEPGMTRIPILSNHNPKHPLGYLMLNLEGVNMLSRPADYEFGVSGRIIEKEGNQILKIELMEVSICAKVAKNANEQNT